MVHRAKTSHIASNFSVIDLATVLYSKLGPRDYVVWSKGWAAATIYYFLSEQGKVPKEDLEKFPNPPYLGLAETTVPGVNVNGGSMGHGLPVAVGMALGKKKSGESGIVYCIMSDGEMQEGTTWESAAIAYHHKLDNLVVIVDENGWQAMGKVSEVMDMGPLYQRWRGFGWDALVIDGHNYRSIEDALNWSDTTQTKRVLPAVIVANTTKGKGVSFMENHLIFHYKHVDEEDFKRALAELE